MVVGNFTHHEQTPEGYRTEECITIITSQRSRLDHASSTGTKQAGTVRAGGGASRARAEASGEGRGGAERPTGRVDRGGV